MSTEISCPHCGEEFDVTGEMERHIKAELRGELTQKITQDLQLEFEKRLESDKEEETAQRNALEKKVAKQRRELKSLRESKIELEDLKVQQEISIKEAKAEARRQAKVELNQELEERISERLKEGTSELELKKKKLELKLERQNEKVRALEEQLESSHSELEGEVLEHAVEDALRDLFPLDSIKSVAKGAFGSDIEQTVMSTTGEMVDGTWRLATAGKILWECKKHKNWNDGWVSKIRSDSSAASADVSVIVTTAMPKGVESFTQIEEVWVCRYHELELVASLLRHALEVASQERKRDQNMMSIQERVAEYISGPKFARVMRSVIEAFNSIEANIRLEENYMKTNRKKNRLLLQGVIDSLTSMAADIHHLGGSDFSVMRELDFDDPSGRKLISSGFSEEGE